MKNNLTYHPFLRVIVCLLLISQIWSSTLQYGWMADAEVIEFCHLIDCEAEGDNKNEKELKLFIELGVTQFNVPKNTANILHKEDFLSLHHPEVTTPPPRVLLFLS